MPPEWGRIDHAAVSQNGNNLSQNFIVPEGAILVGKGIAARDEAIAAFGDDSVGYKPLAAIAQHNLAR